MKDYILRGVTQEGNSRFTVIDSTELVSKAQEIHKCNGTAIAAFGRVLTAAAIMGADLKGEKTILNIKFECDGAIKGIFASANSRGEVKGEVYNPYADLPPNENGKFDVKGIVGNGELRIIKDMGMKEPYVGVVPIVSGEIAEDIAYYFFTSDQVPSVVALGVLVNPDLTIRKAGGYMIQLLPAPEEDFIDKLEKRVAELPSISAMLDKGMTSEEIVEAIYKDIEEANILDKQEVNYVCDCTRDRYYRGVMNLGKKELEDIFTKDDKITVQCHMCKKEYSFTKNEFEEILK